MALRTRIQETGMDKKQVITFIRGGIGNQMFIYAAARRISIKNDAKLVLVSDLFKNESHGRHFLLDMFTISAEVSTIDNTGRPYNQATHRLAKKLDRYLYPLSKHYPHYLIEKTKNTLGKRTPVDPRVLTVRVKDYLYVDGFFQNELYFSDIKETIKSDFTLKDNPEIQASNIASEIKATDSVCIHFRRTELEQKQMLERHGKKRWMRGYKEGLDTEYYLKAIDLIRSKVSSPRFYCFSDHPDWVRNNIKLSVPVTYIDANNTQSTCHGDIYLMSLCKHHIISHSTFGWWGAWLANNPRQVVVAPRNICGRPKPPDYPDTWTTIEVCQRKVT